MKLAFVYAGQGSQKVGMGADFCATYPEFDAWLKEASLAISNVTDVDIKKLCTEGPEEQLSSTRYTQPCMTAFAIGVTDLLKKSGIVPEIAFGLSLGEYSALYAADVFDKKTAMELIAFRGKVMEEATGDRVVKMCAVLGTKRDVVISSCEKATAAMNGEIVQAANFNCPGQIVISGDAAAVDKACELLKEQGTKKILPLKVSGPFHTKLMKPAGDALKDKFTGISFGEPSLQVYFNALGGPAEGAVAAQIPELLEKQVQSSVYLEDSILQAKEAGVDTIIEIGPGAAISKFIKKTTDDITTYSITTVEDLQAVIEAIKGE